MQPAPAWAAGLPRQRFSATATMHRSQLGVALGRRRDEAPMKIGRPAGPDSFHSFGSRARLWAQVRGLTAVASKVQDGIPRNADTTGVAAPAGLQRGLCTYRD